MRLAYLGTPAAAVPPLRALHAAGHELVHVVTGPDRRRGRGGATSPSPVKAAALELGLEVGHEPGGVLGRGAELGVVVAYGRLVPASVLAAVPMVNLHFSLLPRWRGAAPVERAILAGDTETGVCLMALDEGLDTGGVYRRATVPLDDEVTAEELRSELVRVGTDLLVEALASGLGPASPQPEEGVTYAAKLHAEDRRIDFDRPAVAVQRVVRIGGAWTTFRGARLKVLRSQVVDRADLLAEDPGRICAELVVAAGDGRGVRLLEVQPEGRGPMDARSWSNGARPLGDRLGT